MKNLCLVFAVCSLAACAQSGYKQFYEPYVDAWSVEQLEVLADGEEPAVYSSNNLRRDVYLLRSKRFVPIGYSAFNGVHEDSDNARKQAKQIGATLVLVSSEYTNSETVTSALVLPDNETTYHSGSVSADTSYSSVYGGSLGSSSTYGTYSGTSTTYGTKTVPITRTHHRYDQTAVYFVKTNTEFKYGVYLANLEPAQRAELGRNTGAVVDVVVEDTPAFFANVLRGDVIIAIDGKPVNNADHAAALMSRTRADVATSDLRVLRDGVEKSIEVRF